MKRSAFFIALLALAYSPLQAQILLDNVMSKQDQQKTGVANLSAKQKIALEAWLNQNFVPKQQQQTPAPAQLSLSINIDNGQKLQLSDNTLWEISPDDVPTASVWITPIPVKVSPSNNPDYPYLITNTTDGVSIKARKAAVTGS